MGESSSSCSSSACANARQAGEARGAASAAREAIGAQRRGVAVSAAETSKTSAPPDLRIVFEWKRDEIKNLKKRSFPKVRGRRVRLGRGGEEAGARR